MVELSHVLCATRWEFRYYRYDSENRVKRAECPSISRPPLASSDAIFGHSIFELVLVSSPEQQNASQIRAQRDQSALS
jgi:hypothetical protein